MDEFIESIPKRTGIYLFILPKLRSGYVGSSINLKKRYNEHIKNISNKANKTIYNYYKKHNHIEYMVLEYCDNFKQKDLKLIEAAWIDHFRKKGLNLINVSDPRQELIYQEAKPILAYDINTLKPIAEFNSSYEAAKKLKCSSQLLSEAACLKKRKKLFTAKKCFWFYKEDFTEEKLLQLKEEYELSKKNLKNLQSKNGKLRRIPVNQYTESGKFIKNWESALRAEVEIGIYHSTISKCCKGKLKLAGGYIWRYAEESGETN